MRRSGTPFLVKRKYQSQSQVSPRLASNSPNQSCITLGYAMPLTSSGLAERGESSVTDGLCNSYGLPLNHFIYSCEQIAFSSAASP